MRKRDPKTAPATGDRVPYVILKGSKNQPAYEKAEDPIYVLEQNLSIDAQHYIDHQLKQPVMRILENIVPKAESVIFKGEHTLKVASTTPTTGAMSKFFVASLRCLGCKTPIPAGGLCKKCAENKAPEVILEKVLDL